MMGLVTDGFGPTMMILFWALTVTAAIWLVSRLFPQTSNHTFDPSDDGNDSYTERTDGHSRSHP